jgi:hypothetical protein
MKKLLFLIMLTLPFVVQAQIKDDFQQQLQMDHQTLVFKSQLLYLNSLFKKKVDFVQVDSLKQTGKFDFIDYHAKTGIKQLVFDLPQYLASYYLKVEKSGLVPHLQKLRTAGKLVVPSREVASDVELPKKTNPHQSYNDFYLQVIRQLIQKHQSELAADHFNYTVYQQWEADEKLQNDAAVTEFRASFIRFLFSHYHFST